jgi:hypothetical protein
MHAASALIVVALAAFGAGCASSTTLAFHKPPGRLILIRGQEKTCDCSAVAEGAAVVECFEIRVSPYDSSAEARRVLRLEAGHVTNMVACILR